MLRVGPVCVLLAPGPGNERTTVGNVAVAGEAAGRDELYQLDASQTEPEDDQDDQDEDGEDVAETEIRPEGMPHE